MSVADTNPDQLFANTVERVSCALIDLIIVTALTGYIDSRLPSGVQTGVIATTVALLYFTGSWSSPMRATPGQLLGRLRVVDLQGGSLVFWRAAARATLVIGIFVGCVSVAAAPRNWLMHVSSLFTSGLILMATMTSRRQAAHDFVAGSIVVREKALKRPDFRVILSMASEHPPERWGGLKRVRWSDFVQAVAIIGSGGLMIYFGADSAYQRELRARTGYAISQITSLKPAIHAFYLENERLPRTSSELGIARRISYPDGGYYEMDSNGTFQIHFEELLELSRGTLSITPIVTDDGIQWDCKGHGEWVSSHLPAMCRGF